MRAIPLLVLSLIALAAAETRPDFSGSWTLNVDKSDVQEPKLKGAVFKINHREPVFIVTRTLLYESESKNMTFQLRTNGTPVIVPYGDDKLNLAMRWDDGSLVCSIKDSADPETYAEKVNYRLSPDGKVLTVTEHQKDRPRVWVFSRAIK